MNSLSGRLGRLQASLSGRERALMLLRALHAGEEPDTTLRVIDDPVQASEFDRCMGYILAANSELHSITQNILCADLLNDLRDLSSEGAGELLLEQVLELRQELAAVEAVKRQLSEEFGAKELTLPEVRAVTEQVEARLQALLEGLEASSDTPSPDQDRIEVIRRRLTRVFIYWKLIEVRGS